MKSRIQKHRHLVQLTHSKKCIWMYKNKDEFLIKLWSQNLLKQSNGFAYVSVYLGQL